jgi:hypothetical protein
MTLELAVTIIGWVVVGGFQILLANGQAKLQHHFSLQEEKRRYLLPTRLELLGQLDKWFDDGVAIWADALYLATLAKSNPTASAQQQPQLFQRIKNWTVAATRFQAFVRMYDPLFKPDTPDWNWSSTPVPDDMPHILSAFRDEVTGAVTDLQKDPNTYLHGNDDNIKILTDVYRASVTATDRLRERLIASLVGDQQ